MSKFVTFEEDISKSANTITLKSFDNCTLTRGAEIIPGYKVMNNKIYRMTKCVWKKEEWDNYHYWLKEFSLKGKFNDRKFLIMAAWDQNRLNYRGNLIV